MMPQGVIFHIQRFTIHDGPGLRTELFLKGCPLRCRWCSNPESWRREIEPGIYRKKCISRKACGLCEAACPQKDILTFRRGKLEQIDRSVCTGCAACCEACPADAIKRWGSIMTVEECMEQIRRDLGYYQRSGGGVTVSGGEPLLQSEFVAELFQLCRAEGIHTCCESTFHVGWEAIGRVMPWTDLFISDIKHMDGQIHREYTGASNERILENLRRLSAEGKELILRIPVIPGINDDMRNIEATADFLLGELGGRVRTLQLLSFMRLGEEKYESLNLPYPMAGIKMNRRAFQKKVGQLADYFNGRGIHCVVGTREQE